MSLSLPLLRFLLGGYLLLPSVISASSKNLKLLLLLVAAVEGILQKCLADEFLEVWMLVLEEQWW